MSIQILTDRDSGESVMYCNTTEWAFGPVFGVDEMIEDFMDWYEMQGFVKTLRQLSDKEMEAVVSEWRKEVEEYHESSI